MKTKGDSPLINLRDHSNRAGREPILIAHRGGVITPDSPENSYSAIRLAADQAYDMVELDVVEAKDGVPVLFHGPQGHLGRDCGRDAYVHDLTSEELKRIFYRESDQSILTLEKALSLCYDLNLGVMLDVKTYGHNYSEQFFMRIAGQLRNNKLDSAGLSFSQDPLAHKHLGDVLMLAVPQDELDRVNSVHGGSLNNRWWFGLPEQVSARFIGELQKRGALVIVAINRFRYPSHAHEILAERDIEQLTKMGVNGLQIDSDYYRLFKK